MNNQISGAPPVVARKIPAQTDTRATRAASNSHNRSVASDTIELSNPTSRNTSNTRKREASDIKDTEKHSYPNLRNLANQGLEAIKARSGFNQLKQEALDDMKKKPAALPKQENPFLQALLHYGQHPNDTMALVSNPQNQTDSLHLTSERLPVVQKTLRSNEFQEANQTQQLGLLLSHAGVGPGKIFQILASDETLPKAVRDTFATIRSNGAASRTLQEAQAFTDTLFENQRYTLQKLAGVGTIGEVYFAHDNETQTAVVIKMLKDNVSLESLEREKRLATQIISPLCKNKQQRDYQLKRIHNLYKQWAKELDFTQEAENAKHLAHNANRYKVAGVKALGHTPDVPGCAVALVLERAPGVSLDKICELLKAAQEKPHHYQTQFKKEIEQHPWLGHPEQWMAQLPQLYKDAYNEQILLHSEKNKSSASHGDPHSGNVFIDFNPETKTLEATYIDTGLIVQRHSTEASRHLGLMLNSILGNSDALARGLVELADKLPDPEKKEAIIQDIKENLDNKLFKARVNLTDSKYNNQLIEMLLEKHGLSIPEKEITFFKAQMQAFETYTEISKLVNQPGNNYLIDSLWDIQAGSFRLLWQEPYIASQHLWTALKHIHSERWNALRNTAQFFLVTPEHKDDKATDEAA